MSKTLSAEGRASRQESSSFEVVFEPAASKTRVPAGTLVLDAAAQAGLLLDIPCGGQGRCGRCLVKIKEGVLTHRENPHLTPRQIEEGWALACTARVSSDLVLVVPPRRERERVAEEEAAARKAPTLRSDWPRYPAVRRTFLQLPPASLEDSTTDLARLQRALAKELGLERLHIDLPLMRRLAALLRQENWQVTVVTESPLTGAEARLVEIWPGQRKGPLLGLALDLGTTNTVAYLVDLNTGRPLDQASSLNRQVSCGEDVISRIIYSQRPGGAEQLQTLVVETVNALLKELSQRHHLDSTEIQEVVAAGNTVMTHLFLGLPPRYLREEPYIPTTNHYPVVTAGALGLAVNPNASVYAFPSVAAYVGGDITAGVLSSGLYKTDKLTLFMDVGTNGEIVLGNAEWMVTDACSAGPAFEGAGIRGGMRAMRGAIEEVRINSRTLEPTIKVIGNVAPLGICGSGMISALAEMMITGVVSRSGRLDLDYLSGKENRGRMGEHGAEYVLVPAAQSGTKEDIVLSEVDINNLIRAKAAIYAGIEVLLNSTGVSPRDIQQVLIGGAFGQHINVEQAITIGLLPDLPWDRFKYLGNTSAWGAYIALLSKHAWAKAEEIAGKMTYLELIADNRFMNEFTAALFLPHTDDSRFPSVQALLQKQESQA